MDVGLSLPTMAPGYGTGVTAEWCAGIDEGPFSSVSCGERLTFHNPEMIVTLSAAAALTKRARVFANLVVAPLHPPAVLAKQLATVDVVSGGRLTLGVGVGGREHDYRAAGSPFRGRHGRLDDAVAELRSVWAGEPPFDGADPVGPAPVQERIEILAGAMGPKALARAARWADGVSGFSLGADAGEMRRAVSSTRRAWDDAGRADAPRSVSGCFYVLGVADPAATLRSFTLQYLQIFGSEFATAMADTVAASNPERVRRALDDAADAGVDEFILVPATVDPACLEATATLVLEWQADRHDESS